jgi:hypothetical protein
MCFTNKMCLCSFYNAKTPTKYIKSCLVPGNRKGEMEEKERWGKDGEEMDGREMDGREMDEREMDGGEMGERWMGER